MKSQAEILKCYLDSLTKDMGWQIIIEDYYSALRQYKVIANYLSDKNWHTNPYCLKIKKNTRLWQRCVNLKRANIRNVRMRGTPGWNACYCGVAEYTVPIFVKGVHVCTVLSTGFFSPLSDKMTEILSGRTNMNIEDFSLLRENNLRMITPEEEERLASYMAVVADYVEKMVQESPLIKVKETSGGSEKQKHILKALDHIEKHYSEDITPESVAKRCHISLSYLQHLFLEFSNEGVAGVIRRKRLEKACQLLAETDRSVRNIALSCGFYSPDYFSVVFKRTFNLTPLAYRKKFKVKLT